MISCLHLILLLTLLTSLTLARMTCSGPIPSARHFPSGGLGPTQRRSRDYNKLEDLCINPSFSAQGMGLGCYCDSRPGRTHILCANFELSPQLAEYCAAHCKCTKFSSSALGRKDKIRTLGMAAEYNHQ